MSVADDLIAKAERREALFGIVGLGYVGLPLAVELAKAFGKLSETGWKVGAVGSTGAVALLFDEKGRYSERNNVPKN